jgi:predicted RND superfamily exporter protein
LKINWPGNYFIALEQWSQNVKKDHRISAALFAIGLAVLFLTRFSIGSNTGSKWIDFGIFITIIFTLVVLYAFIINIFKMKKAGNKKK